MPLVAGIMFSTLSMQLVNPTNFPARFEPNGETSGHLWLCMDRSSIQIFTAPPLLTAQGLSVGREGDIHTSSE
jgi:hypothetical protein